MNVVVRLILTDPLLIRLPVKLRPPVPPDWSCKTPVELFVKLPFVIVRLAPPLLLPARLIEPSFMKPLSAVNVIDVLVEDAIWSASSAPRLRLLTLRDD